MRCTKILAFSLACFFSSPFLFAASEKNSAPASSGAQSPNLFAQQFFLSSAQQVNQQTYLIDGFAFLETPDQAHNSRYSIITDFGKKMVKSQVVPGLQSVPDIKTWLKDHVESSDYQGVEIRKISLPVADQGEKPRYWIGQKSFLDLDHAKQEIEQLKAVIEAQGGDISKAAREAQEFYKAPEDEGTAEIGCGSNCQKEEAIMVAILEKMDFGDKLFGPLQGTTTGEPIIWRSFGETAWRKTVFESETYSAAVGYWTNQVVFEGLKFPLHTIDPYLEITTALDSTGIDFKSNMIGTVGAEWRPLARNPWLVNFQPYGIPLLEWARNIRFYTQYSNRWNIKGEILNARNYDLQAGISLFYEFGIDLPPIDQGGPTKMSEYIREYVWGELYGNYYYSKTGFSSEDDYDALIANSSITLGFKTPAVHLPDNVFFDQIVLMPYMRFEHVNNDQFSFPYSNRYFVAAGVRWMPFRTYKHKNNEWLAKLKVFGEYAGIGDAQNVKQDEEAPNAITHDLMFGVKFSSNRY